VLVDPSGVTAGPVPPIGDGPLAEAEGGDERLPTPHLEFPPMASPTLCLHAGARPVSYEELGMIEAPAPTATWFPIPHAAVLNAVLDTLTAADYRVERLQLALSRNDARFFGTIDLRTAIGDGVARSVGVRNSIDKSLPIGFCAGSRVFVCDVEDTSTRRATMVEKRSRRFNEPGHANGPLRASPAGAGRRIMSDAA
jgi:hypothetical protein